jgi:hypothetical protein
MASGVAFLLVLRQVGIAEPFTRQSGILYSSGRRRQGYGSDSPRWQISFFRFGHGDTFPWILSICPADDSISDWLRRGLMLENGPDVLRVRGAIARGGGLVVPKGIVPWDRAIRVSTSEGASKMCPLAQTILALAISQATPGRSLYSFEPRPDCGTDKKAPACELRRVCDEPSPFCAPPRWSRYRGGWVQVESPETAIRRYARIAEAAATTASRLVSCKDAQGVVDPECDPTDWPDSERTLALAGLTVALHESGLREDIMAGHPPLGRGPAGEICLLQIAVDQAPLYAHWLPPDDRVRISRSATARERFAKTLLGGSPEALSHCFEVGMRMLVRSRNACSAAGVGWEHGMFAMYGSGARCRLPVVADKRERTFEVLRSAKPALTPEVNQLLGWSQCPPDNEVASSDGLSLLTH